MSQQQNNRRRNGENDEEENDSQQQQQDSGNNSSQQQQQQQNRGNNEFLDMFRLLGMHANQQAQSRANSGDYVSDENLEAVINQLMLANPGPKGNPPAAPYHVQQLDEVFIDKYNKDKIGNCSVCNDEFELNSEALSLPCKHTFHHDCIHPWLNMHNTCPLCRHELPTLDIDYEHDKYEKRFKDNEDYDPRANFDTMYM